MRHIFFLRLTLLVLIGLAAGCQNVPSAESAETAFEQLLDREWENRLREAPTFASTIGDRRYNDRWPDAGLEAVERRHQADRRFLEELLSIDPTLLTEASQLNFSLFRKRLETRIEHHPYRGYLIAFNQRGGIQTADELSRSLPFEQVKDYEDWIVRLETFPDYMDQTIGLLREAIRANMLHPKIIMQRIPSQIAVQLVDTAEESPFYRPLQELSESIESSRAAELRTRAKTAIEEGVIPAFERFRDFFDGEYYPACYDQVGIWQQANGREHYAALVRSFTTTELTPDQVHQTGLAEVARIRTLMNEIIQEVGFEGSFAEFLTFLRTDPRFYYRTADDLLKAYRETAKRIDPGLVRLFGVLPRTPYGVEPIPDSIAPDTTTAYYRPPATDGSRAGTYFVNLYRPEVRPKYEIEALSIHEAVPGHHLQIALARELGDVPNFRRFSSYTAFSEGWALYAESLGGDLGLYKDPYSRFGQLTYEMWRAVRLVVDTGIHAMKWDRRRAIDFFLENAAKTEHDIVNEIDRYIAWPGQALAYKIGELKIKQLRARAEEELGERFAVRDFHDRVLGAGALPLDVLEQRVESWIAEQTK